VGSSSSLGAKLAVVNTSDQEALLIRANSTQSNNQPIIKVETSGGTELFRLHSAGGADNLFFGRNAGNSIAGGTKNIAIGATAGDSLTSGYDNILMGTNAGTAINTGYNNILLGTDAGAALTSASDNVAIGYSSQAYGNANYNVSVGASTLANVSLSGSYNSALGYSALQANTSGQYNAGVGYESLLGNTTGSYNSALGTGSLSTNQTGANNTALGSAALGLNVSGNDNTAVGYNAGLYSTGAGNIFLGSQAGDNLTSGDNNIILGTNIDFASATGSNQLNIAGLLTSTNYTSGNLVIGTSNTTGQLLVLDTKTGAGDPTGVNGGMYYNSNSGIIRCYEAGTWKNCDTASGSSLRSLKSNISQLDMGLETVRSLQAVQYNWIDNGRADIGFIAEDVAAIDSRLAAYNGYGQLTGVNYLHMSAVLTMAIQELDLKVTSLETRLVAVEQGKFAGDIRVGGKIITAGNRPAVLAASAVANNAAVSVNGTDVAGSIALQTGNITPGDMTIKITFNAPYASGTPIATLSPVGSLSAGTGAYIVSINANEMVIGFINPPANNQAYTFNYHIIQAIANN
ncbi:MAG: tail fiber domain-containing protein, partial [Candidatus Saccharimonadales bacterium]